MSESSHLHGDAYSDHLHDIAWDNDGEEFVPSVGFDCDAVSRALDEDQEPKDTVDFADAASAIKSIILWCCAPPDLKLVGARCCSLLAWLDPIEAKTHGRKTLSSIAKQSGYTKQALSKALVELRDSLGLEVGIGKSQLARRKYREAQVKSFAEKRHSSFVRRDKKAAA